MPAFGFLLLLASNFAFVQPGEPNQPTFEARLLEAHNAERARLGMKPLIWNRELASNAGLWAEQLAKTGGFEHAPQSKEGENLWAGTKASYTPEDMVGAWIDEKSMYLPGKFPAVSATGNWLDVGHYTQLIWWNTTSVGCALATGEKEDVLVCRYDPPGNWMAQNPLGESLQMKMVKKIGESPPK
jgi:Cysteine-rich secretory protein family